MARAVPDGLGMRLKTARVAAGIPQQEVAKILQVSRQAVSAWELDAKVLPAPYLAQMAALYFTCAHRLLFGESFREGQFRGMEQLQRTDPMPAPVPRKQRIRRSAVGAAPPIRVIQRA